MGGIPPDNRIYIYIHTHTHTSMNFLRTFWLKTLIFKLCLFLCRLTPLSSHSSMAFQASLVGDRSALWWCLISILISLCLCSGSSSLVSWPHRPSTALSPLPLAFISVLLHPVVMVCLSISLFVQLTTDPLTIPNHVLSHLCQDYRT